MYSQTQPIPETKPNETSNFSRTQVDNRSRTYQDTRKSEYFTEDNTHYPSSRYQVWLKNKTLGGDLAKILSSTISRKNGGVKFPTDTIEEFIQVVCFIDLTYGCFKGCSCPILCKDDSHNIKFNEHTCRCSGEKCFQCNSDLVPCPKGRMCSCPVRGLLQSSFHILLELSFENVKINESTYKHFRKEDEDIFDKEALKNNDYIIILLRYRKFDPNNPNVSNLRIDRLKNKIYMSRLNHIIKNAVSNAFSQAKNIEDKSINQFLYQNGLKRLYKWKSDQEAEAPDKEKGQQKSRDEEINRSFEAYFSHVHDSIPLPWSTEKMIHDRFVNNKLSTSTPLRRPRIKNTFDFNMWRSNGSKLLNLRTDTLDYKLLTQKLAHQGAVDPKLYKTDDETKQQLLEIAQDREKELAKQKELKFEIATERYNTWFKQKEYIDKARSHMSSINQLPLPEKLFMFYNYQFSEEQDPYMDIWKSIGESLKCIDQCLKPDFIQWSKSRYSPQLTDIMWDLLPPVGCDNHQLSAFSRLTFLKLLSYDKNYLHNLTVVLYNKFIMKKYFINKQQPFYELIYNIIRNGKFDKAKVQMKEIGDEETQSNDIDKQSDKRHSINGDNRSSNRSRPIDESDHEVTSGERNHQSNSRSRLESGRSHSRNHESDKDSKLSHEADRDSKNNKESDRDSENNKGSDPDRKNKHISNSGSNKIRKSNSVHHSVHHSDGEIDRHSDYDRDNEHVHHDESVGENQHENFDYNQDGQKAAQNDDNFKEVDPKLSWSLDREEFNTFLIYLGIHLYPYEIDFLFSYFDKDEKSIIPIPSFVELIGERVVPSLTINQMCYFKRSCQVCGLSLAIDVIGEKKDMPVHSDRKKSEYIQNLHDNFGDSHDEKCERALVTEDDIQNSIEILKRFGGNQVCTTQLRNEFYQTKVPRKPIMEISCGDSEGNNLSSSLTLTWRARSINDYIMFFVIEKLNNDKYIELLKDPKSSETEMVLQYTDENLNCYQTYSYRIRAFNATGASKYVYISRSPKPEPPKIVPRIIRKESYAVEINFDEKYEYFQKIRNVGRFFYRESKNGVVPKDTVINYINENDDVKELLDSIKLNKKGQDYIPASVFMSKPYCTVLDYIISCQDEYVDWNLITTFFQFDVVQDDRISTVVNKHKGKYYMERCLDQSKDIWTKAYIGDKPGCYISGLIPGNIYYFRAFIINASGEISDSGQPVSAKTLLPQPDPPFLYSQKSISYDRVHIAFAPYTKFNRPLVDLKNANGTHPDVYTATWSNRKNDLYRGHYSVDWKSKSQQYEENGVTKDDFRTLCQETDVELSEKQEQEIEDLYGDDKDTIPFNTFLDWYNSESFYYIIKIFNVLTNDSTILDCENTKHCVIEDLDPLTEYRIYVKAKNNKSLSHYSLPFGFTTISPQPPEPILVDVTSKEVSLKWYCDEKAPKIIVEIRGPLHPTRKVNWKNAYQGGSSICRITNLRSNSTYQFRLKVNNSEYSSTITASTLNEMDKGTTTKSSGKYNVDCLNDVVIGDFIHYTEVLEEKPKLIEREVTGRVISDNQSCDFKYGNKPTDSKSKIETPYSQSKSNKGTKTQREPKDDRELTIEILSCTVFENGEPSQSQSSHKYLLGPGDRIKISEEKLFQNDVFRKPWYDEDKRIGQNKNDDGNASNEVHNNVNNVQNDPNHHNNVENCEQMTTQSESTNLKNESSYQNEYYDKSTSSDNYTNVNRTNRTDNQPVDTTEGKYQTIEKKNYSKSDQKSTQNTNNTTSESKFTSDDNSINPDPKTNKNNDTPIPKSVSSDDNFTDISEPNDINRPSRKTSQPIVNNKSVDFDDEFNDVTPDNKKSQPPKNINNSDSIGFDSTFQHNSRSHSHHDTLPPIRDNQRQPQKKDIKTGNINQVQQPINDNTQQNRNTNETKQKINNIPESTSNNPNHEISHSASHQSSFTFDDDIF